MAKPLHKSFHLSADPDSWHRRNWDFETEVPLPPLVGAFAVKRANHIHEGIDLYAEHGDPVFAMATGKVRYIGWLTGELAGSPWWANTQGIMIEDEQGIWNYGEITVLRGYSVGAIAEEGSLLGYVTQVLKKDKGRPMAMLHLERYAKGASKWTDGWNCGEPQPEYLRDPTPELIQSLKTVGTEQLELIENGFLTELEKARWTRS